MRQLTFDCCARQQRQSPSAWHIREGDAAPAGRGAPQVSSRSHSDKTQVGPAGRGARQVSSRSHSDPGLVGQDYPLTRQPLASHANGNIENILWLIW